MDNTHSFYQYKGTFLGFELGLDGLSIWLIFLINLIVPILLLHSYKYTLDNTFQYIIIAINIASILVFSVLDLMLFYISFEAVLIPLYYLMGIYGSRNKKVYANYMLILYTIGGSLFLLFSIIYIYLVTGTTNIEILMMYPFSQEEQLVLFIGFFICFAVKIPMYPFHIWLTVAHVEGNASTSVILAAIMLKLGTYGFLRYVIALLPYGCSYFQSFVYTLAIISIVYNSITAISLIDYKQIIAYSSIIHMNICMIGIFSNNLNGIIAAYLYSISHGLVASGLFLIVGVLYDRYHTRIVRYYRGLVTIMPLFVVFNFFLTFSNMSFPGTAGFIPEMLIYISAIEVNLYVGLLVTIPVIVVPVFFLTTYQKISFGTLSPYIGKVYSDINIKEANMFIPLIVLILIFGLYPGFIIDSILMKSITLIV
jgi:proton-translocating NADH-quinone oxidoreductase chain M